MAWFKRTDKGIQTSTEDKKDTPKVKSEEKKETTSSDVNQDNSKLSPAVKKLVAENNLSADKISPSRALTFSWMQPNKKFELNTNTNGEHRAFVVTGNYEEVFPLDIYPLQILKACLVKDLDAMEALGMYEVAPEDFALTEFVCVSKQPHQQIIREGLDLMYKEIG